MAVLRFLAVLSLFCQLLMIGFMAIGLAIFLPATGDEMGTAAVMVGVIIYLGLIVAALIGLRRETRAADGFAMVMATPPLIYFGFMMLLMQSMYDAPRASAKVTSRK